MATEKRLKVNFTNERCIETKFIDSKSSCTKMYAQKHTKYLYFLHPRVPLVQSIYMIKIQH